MTSATECVCLLVLDMEGSSRSIARSVAKAKKDWRAIEVREPKKAALALEMIADYRPYREIVKATGIDSATLTRLKHRHLGAIELRRERAAEESEELADLYRQVSREKADQLLGDPEALSKVNPKDLALTVGIHTDKGMSLRGEATSVVEHKRVLSIEDAKREIEEAMKQIRGEAIDV